MAKLNYLDSKTYSLDELAPILWTAKLSNKMR